jgi:hypothetical protein
MTTAIEWAADPGQALAGALRADHVCQKRPSADNSARRPFADDFERWPIRRTPQRWRIADVARCGDDGNAVMGGQVSR